MRIVPKHLDGTDYELTAFDDPETNTWSLEELSSKGCWNVVADFYNKDAIHGFMSLFTPDEALAGAFLVRGANRHEDYAKVSGGDDGQLEFTEKLMAFGKVVEQVWDEDFGDDGCDSVWAYDVCEPVGHDIIEFMKEYGKLPTDQQVKDIVRSM